MSSNNIRIGETFGIEYEIEDISQDKLGRVGGFDFTHDASILTDIDYVRSDPGIFLKKSELRNHYVYNNYTIGAELSSIILDSSSDEAFKIISNLTYKVMSMGESFRSKRSGIHFHISLPNPNLRILKSLLRLGKHLEQVFFMVGGMGYEFRGIYNDSIYCRPITKYGPPTVPYCGNRVQVFNIIDLLASKTIEEFWEKYGDTYNHSDLRYNPVRYHWLNLYPMFNGREYRGTVEFRLFNKTLNPYYIWAALHLCRAFVEYSISTSFANLKEEGLIESNSIYEPYTKEEVIKTLYKFSEITGIDSEILRDLIFIIKGTPTVVLDSGYVKTHITRDLNRYWDGTSYKPDLISRSKNPNYIDIHVLRGERR